MIVSMRDIHIKSNLKFFRQFRSSDGNTLIKYVLQYNISDLVTKATTISVKIIAIVGDLV